MASGINVQCSSSYCYSPYVSRQRYVGSEASIEMQPATTYDDNRVVLAGGGQPAAARSGANKGKVQRFGGQAAAGDITQWAGGQDRNNPYLMAQLRKPHSDIGLRPANMDIEAIGPPKRYSTLRSQPQQHFAKTGNMGQASVLRHMRRLHARHQRMD